MESKVYRSGLAALAALAILAALVAMRCHVGTIAYQALTQGS